MERRSRWGTVAWQDRKSSREMQDYPARKSFGSAGVDFLPNPRGLSKRVIRRNVHELPENSDDLGNRDRSARPSVGGRAGERASGRRLNVRAHPTDPGAIAAVVCDVETRAMQHGGTERDLCAKENR